MERPAKGVSTANSTLKEIKKEKRRKEYSQTIRGSGKQVDTHTLRQQFLSRSRFMIHPSGDGGFPTGRAHAGEQRAARRRARLQGRPNPQHSPWQAPQLPSPSPSHCQAAIFSTAAAAEERANKAWALPALHVSRVPLPTPGLTPLIA